MILKWKPVTYNEPTVNEHVLVACSNGETYPAYRKADGDFDNGYEEVATFGSTMSLLPRAKFWCPFPECPLVKTKPTTLDKFLVI